MRSIALLPVFRRPALLAYLAVIGVLARIKVDTAHKVCSRGVRRGQVVHLLAVFSALGIFVIADEPKLIANEHKIAVPVVGDTVGEFDNYLRFRRIKACLV